MRFFAWGVLVALAACTSPNPKSCLDGSCTDPRYPFCDENAVIADEPKTCIAVSCTAGEIAECRGDVAVTCNADGNNYDLVMCPHGCDSSGCMTPPPAPVCTTNAECVTATAPICDTASDTCHACATHEDCDSSVCNSDGSCEPTSNVVFASPTGQASSECTKAEPCTLARAVQVETTTPTKVMRMLPGTYSDALDFLQPTGSMVRVIATGAILGASSALFVTGGAKVHIEDLESHASSMGSSRSVAFGNASTSVPVTTVELLRVKFLLPATTEGIAIQRSIVTLDQVDIDSQALLPLNSTTSSITADRLHVRSNNPSLLNTSGTAQNIRVTNSLLENCTPQFTASDTGPSVSQFRFAFNTFAFPGDNQFACPGTADSGNKIIRVENNIIVGTGTQSTAINTPQTCMATATNTMNTLSHNVVFPFTGATGSNIVMDPKFVNAATKDFHILTTSPAHDAATPSADLTTNHDYAGALRSGTFDIGAYELP